MGLVSNTASARNHSHASHSHAHKARAHEPHHSHHKHSSKKKGAKGKLGMPLGAVRLRGGIVVIPEAVNGRRVSPLEMQQAMAALRALPAADIAMVAAAGVQIHLYPQAGLEDGLLGATSIVQDDTGTWRPTLIRAAVRAGLGGTQSIGEIVQHEFGHAISVLRSQDRSEAAAIAYAQKH